MLDREDLSIVLMLADRVQVVGRKDRERLSQLEAKVVSEIQRLDAAEKRVPDGPHKEE